MTAFASLTLIAAKAKGFIVVDARNRFAEDTLCAGSFDECVAWMRSQAWRTQDPITKENDK